MANQHYISETYLRNFSPDGKKGLIHIIEKPGKEYKFKSISKHAASEENYNTLQNEGDLSNALEEAASDIERKVGKIFQKINNNNYEISNDEMSELLLFMAYLSLNVPHIRENVRKFKASVAGSIFDRLGNNEQLLKQYLKKIDVPKKETVDIKSLSDFLKKSADKVIVPKEEIISVLLKQLTFLFEIFANYYWTFNVLKDDSYFITSDVPVVPVVKGWNAQFGPGFGSADMIMFPVSKKVALTGHNKGELKLMEIDGYAGIGINAAMLQYSKHLFSPLTLNELEIQFRKFGQD